MIFIEKISGRNIIRGGVEEKDGFSKPFSLFFYFPEQHSTDSTAVQMRLHGNGKKLASALLFRPLKEPPHHRKPHRRTHFNRYESHRPVGFEPAGNKLSVGAINAEDLFTEPTDEADIGKDGPAYRNPPGSKEIRPTGVWCRSCRQGGGGRFSKAVESLHVPVFSKAALTAQTSGS